MSVPLTKEEALRQIAELQRHVESLEKKKNNHPDKIEEGMLFEHSGHGLCIVHTDDDDKRFMLVFLDGEGWAEYEGFSGADDEFTFLGASKNLLMHRPVITDKLAYEVYRLYRDHPENDNTVSMKYALEKFIDGKL